MAKDKRGTGDATVLDGKSVPAYLGAGEMYFWLRQFDAAERSFGTALRIDDAAPARLVAEDV